MTRTLHQRLLSAALLGLVTFLGSALTLPACAKDRASGDALPDDVRNFKQRVVCEEGTYTSCQWCIRGIVMMETLKEKHGDSFIGIAVHHGYADPMRDKAYDEEYASLNPGGFPKCIFNRNPSFKCDPKNGSVYANAALRNAKVSVGVGVEAQLEADSSTVSITTTTYFASAANDAGYKLSYVLIENNVHDTIPSYNQYNGYADSDTDMGGYENMPSTIPAKDMYYQDVARGFFGPFNGIEGSIPANIPALTPLTHDYTITLPKSVREINNVELVALLIDADGQIANAAKTKLTAKADDGGATGLARPNKNTANATETARYNTAGQRVAANKKGLSIIRMSNGSTRKVLTR